MKHFTTAIILIILSVLSTNCYSQEKAKTENKLASDKTLEVLTWNLEWFGDTKGPSDNNKQMQNAAKILSELGSVDVIVFEEICDGKLFKRLADTLGYNYFVSPGKESDQKISIMYSKNMQVIELPAQIFPEHKNTFAQRQPIQFTFKHPTIGEVTVIGLHLKANTSKDMPEKQLDSYERRKESAKILRDYVSTKLGSKKVIILGDWNDDIDISNYDGKETPLKSILDDKTLKFVTAHLTLTNVESSKYGSVIDHICISNEIFANFSGSGILISVKDKIKKYIDECSDHYPVYSIYE